MSDTITVTGTCPLCKEKWTLEVPREGMQRWNRTPIEQAFPSLSAAERELLLSGFCGKCFDLICPPQGEEEEEAT